MFTLWHGFYLFSLYNMSKIKLFAAKIQFFLVYFVIIKKNFIFAALIFSKSQ